MSEVEIIEVIIGVISLAMFIDMLLEIIKY